MFEKIQNKNWQKKNKGARLDGVFIPDFDGP